MFSLPVAARAAPGWPGFLLLLASASLLVVPLGLWLRRASFRDPTSPDRALLLGTALSSLPLALFGGVLKSSTHHRPLGGVTFGVAACLVLAFCIGLALRVGQRDAVKVVWLSRVFLVACLSSLAVTLVLGARGAAGAVLLDFLTLATACAGAGLLKIPTGLPRAAGPLALAAWLLLALGGVFLSQDAQLMSNLRTRAPVSCAALSWLGGGS